MEPTSSPAPAAQAIDEKPAAFDDTVEVPVPFTKKRKGNEKDVDKRALIAAGQWEKCLFWVKSKARVRIHAQFL